jgi:hypothetical protein
MTATATSNEIRNLDFVADDMEKKLMLLFIFEKMEFPLIDTSISEIIVANTSWMTYMDFRETLYQLCEARFVHRASHGGDSLYCLTPSGRGCLSHFYTKIPASIREEITAYANENKLRFKRSQEYTYDYFKNADGSYTIVLKIKESSHSDSTLEVRLRAESRSTAKKTVTKWKDKAPIVYEGILNALMEE